MSASSTFLLVLGDQDGVSWVLSNSRMAFPVTRRQEVSDLSEGDRLFLLTTRGAFHNPTRDRTRVIGSARVSSDIRSLTDPLEIAGRTFVSECTIEISTLTPFRSGVELGPIVEQMDTFRKRSSWGMMLRRPLVRLTAGDAAFLTALLKPQLTPVEDALGTYLLAARLTD